MKIIFFDGECHLCNGFVDWLIKHDQDQQFYFAPLQGSTAWKLLKSKQNNVVTSSIHPADGAADNAKRFGTKVIDGCEASVVYHREEQIYHRSTAVLQVLMDLGGAWGTLARLAQVMPRPFRDFVYKQIAQNRYRLFGKRESCRLPSSAERRRFLP